MKRISDVELLDAWRQKGDREAMDQLVRRHIHYVYAAARRQVRDQHLAEDVAQAVFMLLMTKSPRVQRRRAGCLAAQCDAVRIGQRAPHAGAANVARTARRRAGCKPAND